MSKPGHNSDLRRAASVGKYQVREHITVRHIVYGYARNIYNTSYNIAPSARRPPPPRSYRPFCLRQWRRWQWWRRRKRRACRSCSYWLWRGSRRPRVLGRWPQNLRQRSWQKKRAREDRLPFKNVPTKGAEDVPVGVLINEEMEGEQDARFQSFGAASNLTTATPTISFFVVLSVPLPVSFHPHCPKIRRSTQHR